MNIDQLRYFADLAKTKSMNTTAKKMFISQPALSESIKRLEEDLGCTLLHRSKTGITFTEDGKMVLEHALRILEHHDQIRHNLQVKYDQEHIYGKLVIGVGPTINDTFLPDLLL
ncbi:MAG: LysR family transcriptional regulator, partial [Peptococcaceae bacterium]|nr:LysR family transcriptional regulator [Peptococcaceae bacterium]